MVRRIWALSLSWASILSPVGPLIVFLVMLFLQVELKTVGNLECIKWVNIFFYGTMIPPWVGHGLGT